MDRREQTIWRGIPTTSVARTLVDLAAVLDEAELARACHEAGVRHHTTPRQVEAVLARRPNTPGAARLRAVLRGDVRVTLSKLETQLPGAPESGRAAAPPDQPRPPAAAASTAAGRTSTLTVELDSYRYHHSRHAWEQDRHREREARARGDEFRRYTYSDVCENPDLMMAELRALIPATA